MNDLAVYSTTAVTCIKDDPSLLLAPVYFNEERTECVGAGVEERALERLDSAQGQIGHELILWTSMKALTLKAFRDNAFDRTFGLTNPIFFA